MWSFTVFIFSVLYPGPSDRPKNPDRIRKFRIHEKNAQKICSGTVTYVFFCTLKVSTLSFLVRFEFGANPNFIHLCQIFLDPDPQYGRGLGYGSTRQKLYICYSSPRLGEYISFLRVFTWSNQLCIEDFLSCLVLLIIRGPFIGPWR